MPLDPLPTSSVLLASDAAENSSSLAEIFEQNGFKVVQTTLDCRTIASSDEEWVDLIILSVNEHRQTALRLTRQIRARSRVGLILVHHAGDVEDAVRGLEFGADDVIHEPFEPRELIARARSVARRTQNLMSGAVIDADRVAFDGWILDTEQRCLVSHEGLRVNLTGAEYGLLLIFLCNPKRALSRDHILMSLKGRPWQATDRSLDTLVARLRRKLERASHDADFIKSVRSVGYVFCLTKAEIDPMSGRSADTT